MASLSRGNPSQQECTISKWFVFLTSIQCKGICSACLEAEWVVATGISLALGLAFLKALTLSSSRMSDDSGIWTYCRSLIPSTSQLQYEVRIKQRILWYNWERHSGIRSWDYLSLGPPGHGQALSRFYVPHLLGTEVLVQTWGSFWTVAFGKLLADGRLLTR